MGSTEKKSRNAGHKAGLKTVEKIIRHSIKKKIRFLTLYAFSTENWKRPESEIKYLFNLLEIFLKNNLESLYKNGVRIKILGNKNVNKKINNLLNTAEKKTSKNNKIQINLALNYGSKNEIITTIKKLYKKNEIINEKNFEKNLFTKNMPNPEILIRTGDTKRLSNFLLWQLAYAEIFFVKKLWPDFNELDFEKIINKYKKIKRNFGKI